MPQETVRLSSDNRAEGELLKRDLEANGHTVDLVLSASSGMSARAYGLFFIGYVAIRHGLIFLDPQPRTHTANH